MSGGNDELFNVFIEIWDSMDTVPVILSMRKDFYKFLMQMEVILSIDVIFIKN